MRGVEAGVELMKKGGRRRDDDGDSGVNMSVWLSSETGELTLVIV